MKTIASVIAFAVYITGIVLAKGFWSTFFAVLVPFWGWYLVIEHFLIKYGLL